MDTGEKWLGKGSTLQSIRSTGAKELLVTLGDVLASAMDINIIQQLREKNTMQRSSGQQDVDTVKERTQSQSMGWNTRNSSLQ